MARYLGDKQATSAIMLDAYRFARRPVNQLAATATDDEWRDHHHHHRHAELCGPRSARLAGRSRWPALSESIFAMNSLLLLTTLIEVVASTTSGDYNQQQQDAIGDQLHPSLLVDTKYWIRNMEFGERDNWRGRLRPCTLLERIAIEEEGAVISLGDAIDNSFGSLESSSVRELVLANNVMLLLEEDTLESEKDYIRFLNESGDCFDSSSLPEHLQDQHWFRFEPSSDELSWFNGANWMSSLNQEIAELLPDSHQIPCVEDVVVFGSRYVTFNNPIEAEERSSVIAFKVNFRPSEQMTMDQEGRHQTNQQAPASSSNIVDTLRVAKLKIGDKSYTQDEFNQLARLYRDSLFDFNDEKSIFNSAASNQSDDSSSLDGGGLQQRALTIDESSIQAAEQVHDQCLDEAGCLCGNERAKMMEIICSFNQPLELDDMLCLDPIRSQGYCNRICATSITINMVPTKFSERYVASLLNKLMTGEVRDVTLPSEDYFSEHIFAGARRTDHTKYEITLRLVPANDDVYHDIIGRDLELAQLIKQQLEKAAIKSFYGIKTINVRSSVLWRRNNSYTIFWLSLITTLSLTVTLFAHYDSYLTELIVSRVNLAQLTDRFHLFNSIPNTNKVSYINTDNLSMSTHQLDRHGDQTNADTDNCEPTRQEQEFAMIEFDARSITDSTHGLLND